MMTLQVEKHYLSVLQQNKQTAFRAAISALKL